jgi:hypothetical protein
MGNTLDGLSSKRHPCCPTHARRVTRIAYVGTTLNKCRALSLLRPFHLAAGCACVSFSTLALTLFLRMVCARGRLPATAKRTRSLCTHTHTANLRDRQTLEAMSANGWGCSRRVVADGMLCALSPVAAWLVDAWAHQADGQHSRISLCALRCLATLLPLVAR